MLYQIKNKESSIMEGTTNAHGYQKLLLINEQQYNDKNHFLYSDNKRKSGKD